MSKSVRPQISNIRIIKEAMREASFLYAELLALGAAMTTVDVGGGLAVDYEVKPWQHPPAHERSPHRLQSCDLSDRSSLTPLFLLPQLSVAAPGVGGGHRRSRRCDSACDGSHGITAPACVC